MTHYGNVWPAERKAIERTHEIRIDFSKQERRWRRDMMMVALALVLVLGFIFANKARAVETPEGFDFSAVNVRTVKEACAYGSAHPDLISNWEDLKQHCITK
jgi:hypothetical protein